MGIMSVTDNSLHREWSRRIVLLNIFNRIQLAMEHCIAIFDTFNARAID